MKRNESVPYGATFWLTLMFFVGICVGITSDSLAHTRSESFSRWQLRSIDQPGLEEDRIDVSLSMKLEIAYKMKWDASNSVEFKEEILEHAVEGIVLSAAGIACPLMGNPMAIISENTGYIRLEWSLKCPRKTGLSIQFDAFFPKAASHTHIARMSIANTPLVEKLFTTRNRNWVVRNAEQKDGRGGPIGPVGSSLVSYWKMGIEHIISGFDHVAFLLGLLLLCRKLRDVVTLITGFTIGHTIILGLGLFGVINPDSMSIEFLIGYTIALVAVENIGRMTGTNKWMGTVVGLSIASMAIVGFTVLKNGPPPLTLLGIALFSFSYLHLVPRIKNDEFLLRPAVTVLFGFIHGSGFAGSLLKIGLPTDRLLPALFGFNLGVESGQLAIVAALWIFAQISLRIVPLLQSYSWQRTLNNLTSAILCGLGIFWFISRAYV